MLAQHYFRVPLSRKGFDSERAAPNGHAVLNGHGGSFSSSSSESDGGVSSEDDDQDPSASSLDDLLDIPETDDDQDEDLLRIWYVSEPFEVVCVFDTPEDEQEEGQAVERPRPLMAVDFGHAVWVEYCEDEDPPPPPPQPTVQIVEVNGVQHIQVIAGANANPNGNANGNANGAAGAAGQNAGEPNEAKRLRFVSFPPVSSNRDDDLSALSSAWSESTKANGKASANGKDREVEGIVRTLEIPEELDLDSVETINIDQSQGAVIISVKEGKIFILCYE